MWRAWLATFFDSSQIEQDFRLGSFLCKEEKFLPSRMKQLHAKPWASSSWERSSTHRGVNVLPVGSLVCVTSYSPFWGFRGTVHSVHTIAADLDEHFCFYLIALEGVQMKVPMWFEYDEVELVAPLVAFQANDELASLKLTPKRAFEL